MPDLTPSNVEELLGGVDLILDGTDNFETRYLINDFAVDRGVPWVYGAAVGSYGIAMPVVPGTTACLRCIYPDPPPGAQPTCETAGVLGSVTALIASWQVSEAHQNPVWRGAIEQDHDRGCLERRHPSDCAAGPGGGLSRVRAA